MIVGSAGYKPHRLGVALDIRVPTDVFSASIATMVRDRAVKRGGPWLKLSGHSVHLAPADQRLWERIRPGIDRDRFQPPRGATSPGRSATRRTKSAEFC